MQTFIAILIGVLILLWFMRGYFIQKMVRIPAITREELDRLMQEEDAVLVDCRREREYRHGHIPGAVNMEAERAEEEFAKLYPDKDHPYVFYCVSGMRSDIVMEQLRKQGYTNLHSFKKIKRYKDPLVQG